MDASYVLWIDVSDTGMSGEDFTIKLAQTKGVLVQEGLSFGPGGEDYIRINLGTSLELVQQAFKRIAGWLNETVTDEINI